MARSREFDAFGPWVDEVQEPEDVPRLFRRHLPDPRAEHLVLKVPRRIDRRDATPDMDLYDHLVIAGAVDLTVLTRTSDGFRTSTVPYDRVTAVRSSVDLLDGRFELHEVRGTPATGAGLAFGFSGVSREVVERLVQVLREQVRHAAGLPSPTREHHTSARLLGRDDLGPQDVDLVTEQRDLAAAYWDVAPLGMHRRTAVTRRGGTLAGAADWMRPVTLHACVVGGGPGELHLLHRRRWFTTGRKPVRSISHTVVLTPRVDAVSVAPSERYEGVEVARVSSGRSHVDVPFPTGAETGEAVRSGVAGLAAH
ncbi:hypothetical protein [Cellulomonas carbonis]|uniref:Uncharacterized protein n=1 Tax=Cellulomonas carbonis T26 TaxID=947969 RepID=A0A0A0BSJ2_9CELL|nr:hypothetical protein [Cellulomonas carbonis]KGM10885.1 hypothetical protein N868_08665 [Cellulomonas carbonis T26]GGC00353.1 hypothetical protein GCM10010972_11370 [Cellulomonas carbonis]